MNNNEINGVDVSECEHHYTNPVNGTIYHGCAIYEQKNELGYWQDTLCEQNPDCYFKQFKRLQEENEKLKAENEQLKKPCLVMPKVNQLAVPIEKYEKLYKALEEIRGIAGDAYDNDQEYQATGVYNEILDKINEVLNDRD